MSYYVSTKVRLFFPLCVTIPKKNEFSLFKAIHQTFVTTYGLKKNMYSGNVQSEVVLDDLFAE